MFKVKIYGAGSIGNHLAQASRSMGWDVYLCDIDDKALTRTKSQIYPARYGKWDEAIHLLNVKDAPRDIFDLIIIGTSPDHHVKLALDALTEKPKAILVEKPFCTPDLVDMEKFHRLANEGGIKVFVGYDHVVGLAAQKVGELIAQRKRAEFQSLDVEFREHWAGIFSAHSWLTGPADTYLGYWQRGGGASGEHSHAINLWQHFAHLIGAGRITEVSAMLNYVQDKKVDYDRLCCLNLRTEDGFSGRVVQDVITMPPRKWGRIQAGNGYIELTIGFQPGTDAIFWQQDAGAKNEALIKKTRPDDFITELKHIEKTLQTGDPSPIALERGLDTMLVVAAAHKSTKEKRTVIIDYQKGYTGKALK
ncbi:MAG: Gfo/Idh/MocA family oxidoreductase [bacterium]|nr:Gfo/Idh/MocA family oxidoreductase [bacterium]